MSPEMARRERGEANRLGLKGWFGGGKQSPQEYTIDDLIVLEKYEEAEGRLRAKLKASPQDLHSHLKLAEVYSQTRQFEKAVDEFGFVADEYAGDGFYDKGIALLSKAMKLAPLDQSLRFKIDRLQREKSLEHARTLALEGLRQAGGHQGGTSALELGRLWHNMASSSLVQHLSGEQMKRLFSSMRLLHYKEVGTILAEEGSKDAFLLLIVRGVVEAMMAVDGKETGLRSFTAGDILGEAVLLERGVWPATYRVTEPGTVLELTREGLEQSLLGNPDPKAFLDALREQHNDRDVAASVRRLRAGS
ncbi:MAG TPA: cyclic nucleotide-binding domain-containing protein [Thermoanaerobaculia bacterium]|nr:cyclic nucleotide-binding domain-containing protein [Thermoanaerobaculia bacterium]